MERYHNPVEGRITCCPVVKSTCLQERHHWSGSHFEVVLRYCCILGSGTTEIYGVNVNQNH